MTARQKLLLGTCFFLSGATSLVLEVAWSKALTYILGNSLYAVATVVAAFMGGLALGSAIAGRVGPRIASPLRAYALLQFAIALCGAVSIPVFKASQPLFGVVYQMSTPGTAFALRFAAVSLLMIVPATLMGMSLPIVVGAVARREEDDAFHAGVLYGVNTLGAVAGTFGAGFLLIPALGLWRTCVAAAVADTVAAAVAWVLHSRIGAITSRRSSSTESRGAEGWTWLQRILGAVFAVSGAMALACEVAWFRILGLTIGPSVYAFAAMLGCFLLTVGAGSVGAARWAETTRLRGIRAVAVLQALLAAAVLGGLYYVNAVPAWNFAAYRWTSGWSAEWGFALSHILIAVLVVGPACLVMGALFPFIVKAIGEAGAPRDAPEHIVGTLYMLNTAGGIAGSLAAGFWLLPRLGASTLLAGAAVVNALLAATLWTVGSSPARSIRLAQAALVVLVAGLAARAAPQWNAALFNQGYYREIYTSGKMDLARLTNQKLLFYSEGINSPVAVFNVGGEASLRVTGKTDASTNPADIITQLFVGHLPVLFAPDPRRAAVIGYGSGISAMAMLAHQSVQQLDVIELERAVVEASPYFEHISGRPLDDRRAHLVVDDGRTYFTYADQVYDVIASEPSNPWMAGVSNLFTVDFYRIVRRRLSPRGVFGQWIQTYEISADTFRTILATLHAVFPHVILFQSGASDVVVLASAEPIRMPWTDFEKRFTTNPVRASLARAGITNPFHIASYMRGSGAALADLVKDATVLNTDDNVWLEHRMPRDMVKAIPSNTTESVSQTLASLGTARYLATLQETLPGLSLQDAVSRTLEYLFVREPAILPGGVVVDVSLRTRMAQTAAMRREIEAMGDSHLLIAFDAHHDRRQRDLDNRMQAARLLAGPLAQGRVPDFETAGQASGLASDLPQATLLVANHLFQRRQLAEAEAYYRRLTDNPTIAGYDALVGLGNIAVLRGQFDEANRILERAIARNPYLPNAYTTLAILYRGRNDTARARDTLVRALRLNPGQPDLESRLRSLDPVR